MTLNESCPAPDLYAVDFEAEKHLIASVILTATCALAARSRAWELFSEHKRRATGTRVYRVEYVEMDWETNRTIMLRGHECKVGPTFLADEPDLDFNNDWHIEEEEA
jgi:hypothetical protein